MSSSTTDSALASCSPAERTSAGASLVRSVMSVLMRRILITAWFASLTLSRMRLARSHWNCRSASLTGRSGCFNTVNGWRSVVPSATRRTW
jgi:hypothetical protein